MLLKTQMLMILNALAMAGSPLIKAFVTIAVYAVNKFVPDTAGGVNALVGAAPDAVKSIVGDIFAHVIAFIPSDFVKNILHKLYATVLTSYLDKVWDGLMSKTPMKEMAQCTPDEVKFCEFCCE